MDGGNLLSSQWQLACALRAFAGVANMGMGMRMRLAAAVNMRFRFERNRNEDEPAVANAALGDDMLGEMANVGGRASQHGDLKTGMMIEMDVHGCERQVMMIVLGRRQPLGKRANLVIIDIDERPDTRPALMLFGRPLQTGTYQVAQGLRPVLVVAIPLEPIKLFDEPLIERCRNAFHVWAAPIDMFPTR